MKCASSKEPLPWGLSVPVSASTFLRATTTGSSWGLSVNALVDLLPELTVIGYIFPSNAYPLGALVSLI